MALDAATISAVAALVVAVIAMFIAMAQAIQQYLITGQLIRLCDSVVFGPMPGKGRRVWQLSQFRFRVLYSIPQISLKASLWPRAGGAIMKSHAIGRHRLPRLTDDTAQDSDSDDGYSSEASSRENSYRETSIVYKKSLFAFLRFPWRIQKQREATCSEENGPPSVEIHVGKTRIEFPFSLRRRRQPVNNSSSSTNSSGTDDMGVTSATAYRGGNWIRSVLPHRHRSYPVITSPSPSPPGIGEASWVSFCRAIEFPCGGSVRIDFVHYDADRCPGDLVSAPMQTSMRDVVMMGLMAGMELTSASFDDKSVSMQGAIGTLTSSNHPVLGPILHFTRRHAKASLPQAFGIRRHESRGSIDRRWMARTWGVCSVANRYYNSTTRRTARRLDDRWIRDHKGVKGYELHRGSQERSGRRKHWETVNGKERDNMQVYAADGRETSNENDHRAGHRLLVGAGGRPGIGEAVVMQGRKTQDGFWTITVPAEPPRATVNQKSKITNQRDVNATKAENTTSYTSATQPSPSVDGLESTTSKNKDEGAQHPGAGKQSSRHPTVHEVPDEGEEDLIQQVHQSPVTVPGGKEHPPALPTSPPPPVRRRTTVEEAPEEVGNVGYGSPVEIIVLEQGGYSSELSDDRVKTAKALQAARAERLRKVQKDKEMVSDSVERGAMSSPYDEASRTVGGASRTPLLLTNYAHNPEKETDGRDGEADEPTAEEEAAREREKKREEQRLERDEERHQRNLARNQAVTLTNVDVFWMCQMDVTPGFWATPWHDAHLVPLTSAIDGAVTVVLEALLGFLDNGESLVYTRSWIRARKSFQKTARWMFNGNITYPAYAQNARGGVIAEGYYTGVRVPAFKSVIPVLELLFSYDWQVSSLSRTDVSIEEQNVELMRLDAWLSYVGRTEEITRGPHNLLKQCPALVQLLMVEFELDFQNIDLSAKEGGLQDIQGLAANVMDFLTDEELNEVEQLYVLVALLRTMKVARCVRAGSDTTDLRTILERDVQVHLV